MTTQNELQDSPLAEEAPAVHDAMDEESPLVDALGKLGLATIGAVSFAFEGAERLLRVMVERGEADERRARRMLKELGEKRPHLPKPPGPVVAIGAGNLASKSDIAALEHQVAALTAQVERLGQDTPQGL